MERDTLKRGVYIFIALFLALLILYFAIPTAQRKVAWCSSTLYSLMEDNDFEVPREMQPKGSVRDHYSKRGAFSSKCWGSVHMDGPDRAMPDQCYWLDGILHCKPNTC